MNRKSLPKVDVTIEKKVSRADTIRTFQFALKHLESISDAEYARNNYMFVCKPGEDDMPSMPAYIVRDQADIDKMEEQRNKAEGSGLLDLLKLLADAASATEEEKKEE